MSINNIDAVVQQASTAFSAKFNEGFKDATQLHMEIATTIPSSAASSGYGFLQQVPKLEEWLAARQLKKLDEYDYEIKNKLFESSIKVKRTDFEDNDYGKYSPIFQDLGSEAAQYPNDHVFDLLKNGLTGLCFDGLPYFDADHPVGDVTASNYYPPADPANKKAQWYLLDTNRAIKPLIWQERLPPNIQRVVSDTDSSVFLTDEFMFGVRARGNAGYGFWQLAAMCDQELNSETFSEVYEGMIALKGTNGTRPLRVTPKVLVVPPSLRQKAYETIKREKLSNGESNINFEIVDIIVSPYL